MTFTYPKEVIVSTDVLSQEVDGETVLLDTKGENYFGLDKLGSRIWQLLKIHSDPLTIHKVIQSEYDVDSEQLQKDLTALLEDLCREGLVTVHD